MRLMTVPPSSALLLVVTSLVASSGCVITVDSQAHTSREERRFTVSGTPDVSLVTFDGAIEVRTWDRSEVLVEIEKRGATPELIDALEVQVEQTGDRISVEARRPRESSFGIRINTRRSVKLIASVPRQANLLARSGDGSITVERVAGRVELRTGDGRIRGIDLNGELTARTGDGSVRLEAVEGQVDVTTGDGSVTVAGQLTKVRLRTGDGSIRLRVEPGSTMGENWDVSTSDGGVTLYLPQEFDANLDALTGDGSVRSDEELALQVRGDRGRRSIRGMLGAGGNELRVRTGDGSIRVRRS